MRVVLNSSHFVRVLAASLQTMRSAARVVFNAQAYPALRTALSQDSA